VTRELPQGDLNRGHKFQGLVRKCTLPSLIYDIVLSVFTYFKPSN